MRVFVAGGTGVLGRPTVRALVAAGHRVSVVARGPEKADLLRRLGAGPIEVDLYDRDAVRRAMAGSEVVLRLTSKIPQPMMKMRSEAAWRETNRLRTEGARALVDAAIAEGVRTYVHESVAFVYADGGDRWLDEGAPTDDGRTQILRAVLAGEQEAARVTASGGRGIVLRFGGVYAPDAPSTAEMVAMARRRMLVQFGAGANYMPSIYVPDAARAVVAALEAPAGVYNVCDDNPATFAEYVRTLAVAVGAPPPRRLPGMFGPAFFGVLWRYLSRSQRVSSARLKAVSGWSPAVKSVAEGWPLVVSQLGDTDR